MKNILIIGNGFDIAHELPTRYIDFLKMCQLIKKCKVYFDEDDIRIKNRYKNTAINEDEKGCIVGFINKIGRESYERFYKIVMKNFWIKYFIKRKIKGEKWLDFEEEIKNALDKIKRSEIRRLAQDGIEYECLEENIDIIIDELLLNKEIKTYIDLYEHLLSEHEDLITLLDIYMGKYISKIDIKKDSFFENRSFDNVLSFNYTNTYERIYNPLVNINYIHGRTSSFSFLNNNMVLGFDDHYIKSEKMINEFIPFEKYYQRIVKYTDCDYYEWLENNNEEIVVHIYGHSCAPSDGDVLRSFILNDNAKTIVYCIDEIDRANKIKNLAIVLEPDKLIQLTGKNKGKLIFPVLLKSMFL